MTPPVGLEMELMTDLTDVIPTSVQIYKAVSGIIQDGHPQCEIFESRVLCDV